MDISPILEGAMATDQLGITSTVQALKLNCSLLKEKENWGKLGVFMTFYGVQKSSDVYNFCSFFNGFKISVIFTLDVSQASPQPPHISSSSNNNYIEE